jgi:rfaE bifunctional protein nucleotidyltransferase chain/domain
MIINDRDLLSDEIAKLRKERKRIVFTNGCFDLLHKGHVDYLNEARKLGDVLVVGLNTDESVRKLKGPQRPIMPLESRAAVLDALKPVSIVVPFGESTPVDLIRIVKPDVHVKGGDYKADSLPEYEAVLAGGGHVKIIPLTSGFSVTAILERIRILNSRGGSRA